MVTNLLIRPGVLQRKALRPPLFMAVSRNAERLGSVIPTSSVPITVSERQDSSCGDHGHGGASPNIEITPITSVMHAIGVCTCTTTETALNRGFIRRREVDGVKGVLWPCQVKPNS